MKNQGENSAAQRVVAQRRSNNDHRSSRTPNSLKTQNFFLGLPTVYSVRSAVHAANPTDCFVARAAASPPHAASAPTHTLSTTQHHTYADLHRYLCGVPPSPYTSAERNSKASQKQKPRPETNQDEACATCRRTPISESAPQYTASYSASSHAATPNRQASYFR